MTNEPTDHPSEVGEPRAAADRPGSGDVPPPIPPPAIPQPPTPPPPAVARRLVRDPYTRLGGVASGLSHHYGVDVSLVRLAFVLFTLVTGFGLLVYILAWLIIPRADYWPPVGAPQQLRSISSREFGTGIVILAVLMGLFFSGGTFSQVLVPLLLVAGGLWLLLQPSNDSPPAPSPTSSLVPPAAGAAPVDTVDPAVPPAPGSDETTRMTDAAMAARMAAAEVAAAEAAGARGLGTVDGGGGGPPPPPPPPVSAPPGPPVPPVTGAVPPGTPVPPRRRRWARLLIVLLVLLLAVPFIAIAVAVAFLAAGGIDFGSGFDARYRPETVDEIPAMIDHGSGELVVDLTEIDPADYDGDPVPLAIDMSFGDITVLVPDDLRTSVDAQVSAGDVQVFGNSHDGLGADVSVDVDDADLELDIELEFGQITVQRAG